MNREELLRELAGGVCRCGQWKHGGQTFCSACFRALPGPQRRALYLRFGGGYEEAYAEAVKILDGRTAKQGTDDGEVVQARLDDAVTGRTIQSRFDEFDRANPRVYQTLVNLAMGMLERGHRRIGLKHIWEVMRWQLRTSVNRAAGDPKLPNDYTSRYARKIIREHPELEKVIVTRRLRAP